MKRDAKEEKQIDYRVVDGNKGIFTEEELKSVGLIPISTPIFEDNSQTFACATYKLRYTFKPEIEQDLKAKHKLNLEDEIKNIVLQEISTMKNEEGKKLKYVMNVYKGRVTINPDDLYPIRQLIVRGVFV